MTCTTGAGGKGKIRGLVVVKHPFVLSIQSALLSFPNPQGHKASISPASYCV